MALLRWNEREHRFQCHDFSYSLPNWTFASVNLVRPSRQLKRRPHQSKSTHAWDAEIERVRGDIIAMKPDRDVAAAMSAYEASLAISRRQKARLFELKTTVSFARQLQKIGRQVDARRAAGQLPGANAGRT